jgi:hypothetical protein
MQESKYLIVITVEGGERHSRVMTQEESQQFLSDLSDKHVINVPGELTFSDKVLTDRSSQTGDHELHIMSCNVVSARVYPKSGEELAEILDGTPVAGSIETPAVDNEGTVDHPDITDPREPDLPSEADPNATETMSKQTDAPF